MNTFQQKMESILLPLATKLNANKYVATIRDAFTLIFPLTLSGSLIILINFAIFSPDGFIAKLLHLNSFIPNLAEYQRIFSPVLNGTTNIMSILIVFLTAYKIAENNKADTILTSICALSVYFIIYPPYVSTVDGKTALSMDFMGAQGLFVAIIVGLLVGDLLSRLQKNERLKINMPDGVPPAVVQSFNGLIPIMIILAGASIFNYLFTFISEGGIQQVIYTSLQGPFSKLGSNIFSILILSFVQNLLWIVGIHGPNTLGAIRSVMFAQAGIDNLAYYGTHGTTVGTPFPVTWTGINDAFASTGGSGATLGLLIAIWLIARKDKHQMEIAKLSIAPGLFNINEPVIFGMPIVMNPIYVIPFILAPLACNIFGYLMIVVFQIIPPVSVDVGWTTPGFLIPFLGSGGTNYLSLVAGIASVGISTLIYLPFVRIAMLANLNSEQNSDNDIDLNDFTDL